MSENLTTVMPQLLNVIQASRVLHISRSHLYALLMRGDIPSIKIGRARRIPVSVLKEWIERQLEQADSGEAPNA